MEINNLCYNNQPLNRLDNKIIKEEYSAYTSRY